ncbi:stromal membrane-associated protein 1 [Cordyceps javanica]|uniref:Stromal membrane-associated protein 1 n=1 Tax=Cordyceps javanica TaxID=43265 RepID=A0A545V8P5_9HYPO|nr:stromal membrane-associated protein 1 [Cordyceps javanica]TQW08728.1 stromal membrane-associated protein 1 [Cordyceps javanica]
MSRRAPNPAAERAAQNQATIKNLLKLEANKICSDCKKNKHPRWASWNLGVFICIRCSGIHRGMGTHISRVKSVDLDSWTDEQLQSVLRWGNARANKYWEAKLAAGHAPSEAKIENFIRTKYELKRWVMDGPMPDPATLDADADDDVPLSLVREKQVIEKKETARKASVGHASRPSAAVGDLLGGADAGSAAAATPPRAAPAAKAAPAPPKTTTTTTTRDSLLGLDFLGESSAPPRPSSTPAAQAQSRPDLKQSILSLYATAPKPQQPPQQQQQQQQQQNIHQGGWGSPQMGHHQQPSQGGFADAFGGLSLSNPTSPKPPAADPFAGLGSGLGSRTSQHASNNNSSSFGGLSGGSFFDSKPAPPPVTNHSSFNNNQFASSSSGGFGDFASPVASAPAPSKPAQTSSASAMGDLFDLSAPMSQSSPPPVSPPAQQPAATNSVFNLSAPQSKPASSPAATAATASITSNNTGGFSAAGLSGVDAWGGNEWATPAAVSPAAPAAQPAASKPVVSNDIGWGSSSSAFANTPIVPGAGGGFNPAPKVTADEEFGGWASSTGTGMGGQAATAATSTAPKTGGGFGGDDDLFSNVWQ